MPKFITLTSDPIQNHINPTSRERDETYI